MAAPSEMMAVCLDALIPSYENGKGGKLTAKDLQQYLTIKTVPRPKPGKNQVLIKVERSSINPADLMNMKGAYGDQPIPTPYFAGFEGTGTVIESGGGMLGWAIMGKRVTTVVSSGGMWAEYVVADAMNCVQLPDNLTWEEGSAALVNPLTAVVMVEKAKAGNYRTILHTGAASALGKMLIRHAKQNGIQVICVVRREEQAETCRKEGATSELVLNSEDPEFDKKLKEVCEKTRCRLAFDAVSGSLTGRLIVAMPHDSTVYVYGSLSGLPVEGIPPRDLIWHNKTLKGFVVTQHVQEKSFLGKLSLISKVKSVLQTGVCKTNIVAKYRLQDIHHALERYINNMSEGKILLVNNQQVTEGVEVVEESKEGKKKSKKKDKAKDKDSEKVLTLETEKTEENRKPAEPEKEQPKDKEPEPEKEKEESKEEKKSKDKAKEQTEGETKEPEEKPEETTAAPKKSKKKKKKAQREEDDEPVKE